ncbi:hypothetical protein [Paenibacillus sp. CAA11]|nr:hypothetical protein [Paenibacillus sp. CAA11]
MVWFLFFNGWADEIAAKKAMLCGWTSKKWTQKGRESTWLFRG